MKSGAADTGSMRGGHLLQEKEVFVALETFTDGTDVEKHLLQTFIGVCRHRTQQNRCEKKPTHRCEKTPSPSGTHARNHTDIFYYLCVFFSHSFNMYSRFFFESLKRKSLQSKLPKTSSGVLIFFLIFSFN